MTTLELIFALVVCTIIVCIGILIKLWNVLHEIKREDAKLKLAEKLDETDFQRSARDWLDSRANRSVAVEGARPTSTEERQ